MNFPERRGIHQATVLPGRRVGTAEPRTAPDVQTPAKQKKKANPILRGLAVLGILTAGGAVAYGTISQVRDTLNKGIERMFGDEVPSTFDNSLDEGVISDSSVVRMTKEEIQKLPKFDGNGKLLRTFPIGLSLGEQVEYRKEFSGGMVHPGIDIDPKTTKNILKAKISTGKPIIASSDGYLFENFGAIILMSFDKEGKPSRQIYGLSSADSFQMTVDAPKLSADNRNGKEWEKGLEVLDGELIAVTTKDVEFEGTIIDSTGKTFYDPLVEGNWNLKTDSSKLVTSQEQ